MAPDLKPKSVLHKLGQMIFSIYEGFEKLEDLTEAIICIEEALWKRRTGRQD